MHDIQNEIESETSRIAERRFSCALEAFLAWKNTAMDHGLAHDGDNDNLSTMVADLLHLSKAMGITPEEMADGGIDHFYKETDSEHEAAFARQYEQFINQE